MLRFVVTAIKKNGQRELAFNRNHMNTHNTAEEAKAQMDNVLNNNMAEDIADLVGTDLEVRPVECYLSGDPKTCYFK